MSKELARLIAGYVLLHSSMAGVRIAAPLMALTLGYDKASVGALVALVALPQVFLSLPAGRWADRRGMKVPVRHCAIIATVGAGIVVVWPAFPALCVSSLLIGGAIGAATIALQWYAGRMARSATELKQVFSWLSLAPALSSVVAPLATGLVIDQVGYRAAFLMFAVLPVAGWLWIRTAHELPRESAVPPRSGTAWNLWREPQFRRLLLINWFMSGAWDVHNFVVPVLGHERGLPATAIGSILAAFAAAATAVRVAMPLLAARLREWTLITGAMAATGLMFTIYPFAPSLIAMGLCSAVIGLAVGSIQPMIMSLLHQITPRHRHGEAVAMRFVIVSASSVAMPVLFGAVGGLIGVSGIFWVVGCMIGLSSRLGFGLRGISNSGKH